MAIGVTPLGNKMLIEPNAAAPLATALALALGVVVGVLEALSVCVNETGAAASVGGGSLVSSADPNTARL
jgi:hypothetical protein